MAVPDAGKQRFKPARPLGTKPVGSTPAQEHEQVNQDHSKTSSETSSDKCVINVHSVMGQLIKEVKQL
jgi:hypothetical protein